MSIMQILPANGCVAAHWQVKVREKSGGEPTEHSSAENLERVGAVASEPVMMWAVYDTDEVHGLINYRPDPNPCAHNKAANPTLLPANEVLEHFLGYARSEAEAIDMYDGAAQVAYLEREGKL